MPEEALPLNEEHCGRWLQQLPAGMRRAIILPRSL